MARRWRNGSGPSQVRERREQIRRRVVEEGLARTSMETVAVKRALMESADRRVLVIDHTKFSKRGLHQLAPLTAFDAVIVDAATSDTDLAALRAQGVHLQIADAPA